MDGGQYSGLTKIALAVLAVNSGLAIYNSWLISDDGGDRSSVVFVLAADAILLLLFLCLRELEPERAAGRRGRDDTMRVVRAAVWALTTLLSVMFASRVAPPMPPVVGALVWAMAVATAAAGFWACFLT